MNWISIGILGYMGLGALSGMRRGLTLVLFSVAGYIAGLIIASRYQKVIVNTLLRAVPIQRWIAHYVPLTTSNVGNIHQTANHWTLSILGVLVFLLVIVMVESLGRSIGSGASQVVRGFRVTGFLNGVGGLAAGIVENGIVLSLILGLLVSFPLLDHTSLVSALDRNSLVAVMVGWFHRLTVSPVGKWL